MADLSRYSDEDLMRMARAQSLSSLSDDQLVKLHQASQTPGFLDMLGRKLASGMTFGWADEIASALESATTNKTFDEALEANRAADRKIDAEYPVAGTVAEFAGGVATGLPGAGRVMAAKALQNVPTLAKLAGVGAAAGGLAGAGYAEGGAEETAKGAATGAVAGGVLGAAVPVVAGAVNKTVVQPVLSRFGSGPTNAAQRKLLETLSRDAPPGTDPIKWARARLAKLGPEATIADLGENAADLTRTASSVPGRAKQMAGRVFTQRQGGQARRIQESAQKGLGTEGRFYASIDDLMRARKEAAAPLYEQAYAKDFVWSDDLQTLLDRPSGRQAIARAYRIAAEEGRDPKGLGLDFNEAGDVIFTKVPSMQTLDYVKRGLDDVVEQFRDPVTGKLRLDESGRAINSTRAAFVGELRRMNPEYSAALDAWGGPSQSLEAINLGRNFAKGDMEITAKRLSELSDGDKEFFREGVTRAITDLLESQTDGINKVRRLFGSPAMRKKLEAVFPDSKSFREFQAQMLREAKMFSTKNTVLGGSPTARITASQQDAAVDVGGPVVEAAQGNIGNALMAAVRGVGGRLGQMPEAVREQLGNALLAQDPATQQRVLNNLLVRHTMRNLPPAAQTRAAAGLANVTADYLSPYQ